MTPSTGIPAPMVPIALPPNLLRRSYRGGGQLARFRGVARAGERVPEDWVGSTVTARNEQRLGLAALPDGTLVRDLLAADPVGLLGHEHVAAHGADPAILVKLLDAEERLPIHCHPSRRFAAAMLGTRYGKTEACVVLAAPAAGASIAVGFRRPVGKDELAALVAAQDRDALAALLHELPLAAGDVVFIPAGVPHALGPGALVLEIQEPSDLSVMLAWEGFELDVEATRAGLPLADLLTAVDRRGRSAAAVEALVRRDGAAGELLPATAAPFFGLERLRAPAHLPAGFAIVVATAGAGALRGEHGTTLPLRRGDAALVPHAAGPLTLDGDLELLRCTPPRPDAARPTDPDTSKELS